MASSSEYLTHVLDLLTEAEAITSRAMMGEYVLYSHGKVFDRVSDDRFLFKDTEAARALLPSATRATPYPGAKQMPLVESEDRELLAQTIRAMFPVFPNPDLERRNSRRRKPPRAEVPASPPGSTQDSSTRRSPTAAPRSAASPRR
ncbi:transcriptional regulator [Leucobacter chromiireducens subsp. chromiireducens]|uniref:Transcriptional regulator n=2 Tax=Leucobacter TaxID=55968 RepID=A0ABS1SQ21_9MICO|nr:transcriptional regulator [Leucobacter chromiireducens subsp. chromiireducens]